jgi:thiol-disulfide isomerase/thioredoxin
MNYRHLLFILLFILGCEKEKKSDIDQEVIDNYSITDIKGTTYELETTLNEYDYLLFFGFATWCHWSLKSIPQIRSIDSLYSNKIQIIAVEGSPTFNNEKVNEFIEIFDFDLPIVIRIENTVLNYILYPDSALAFPSFLLIGSGRTVEYRQKGYLVNTLDSIVKYSNLK